MLRSFYLICVINSRTKITNLTANSNLVQLNKGKGKSQSFGLRMSRPNGGARDVSTELNVVSGIIGLLSHRGLKAYHLSFTPVNNRRLR